MAKVKVGDVVRLKKGDDVCAACVRWSGVSWVSRCAMREHTMRYWQKRPRRVAAMTDVFVCTASRKACMPDIDQVVIVKKGGGK